MRGCVGSSRHLGVGIVLSKRGGSHPPWLPRQRWAKVSMWGPRSRAPGTLPQRGWQPAPEGGPGLGHSASTPQPAHPQKRLFTQARPESPGDATETTAKASLARGVDPGNAAPHKRLPSGPTNVDGASTGCQALCRAGTGPCPHGWHGEPGSLQGTCQLLPASPYREQARSVWPPNAGPSRTETTWVSVSPSSFLTEPRFGSNGPIGSEKTRCLPGSWAARGAA